MKPILSLIVVAAGLLEVTNAAGPTPLSRRAITYKGCFSSNGGATLANDTDIYNSRGACQILCTALKKPVLLVSNAIECWCGDKYPASSTKVEDTKCNTPCVGYDLEVCGGIGFYSVALDGLTTSAEEAAAPVSSSSTSSTKPSTPSSTPPTSPSVVTTPVGATVTTTAPPKSTSTSESKKSGTNVAAIAAGVVIGFVGIAAVAAGVFFFMRHKRRREIEEEHRRNAAVSSFIGNQKPPSTSAGSSFTDTRLDPVVMAGRRMSDGSIADNQDYSRRILKVTNA